MPRSSADGIGETDLARLDAHVIQPDEYAELPEITDAMIARGAPGDGTDRVRSRPARSRSDSPKQQITLRLDADVVAAMRASGPGWQVRANDALRKQFKR